LQRRRDTQLEVGEHRFARHQGYAEISGQEMAEPAQILQGKRCVEAVFRGEPRHRLRARQCAIHLRHQQDLREVARKQA
jgi:hypothetical protein